MNSLVNFVSTEDLISEARPEALIKGFIREQEAVCLYGEPNGGKSFLALDWALCVATGKPWLDTYEVKQGPVIYMAGEGGASLQIRVEAWMKHHGIPAIHGAYWQTRPLPLRDEETIEEIQDALDYFAPEMYQGEKEDMRLPVQLIVVDTLSQFMMGGDENGPDMALFVSNCRRLSQNNNTAVLIVHHTNKGGLQERGHTALRGNVDTMFKCTPVYEDNLLAGIDVGNDKQRDQARTAAHNLRLKSVVVGEDSEGQDISSLVVIPTMAPPSKIPTVKSALLCILEAMLQTEDLKTEKCHNQDIAEYTNIHRGTIHKRLERLAAMGLVKHREGKSALTTLGRAVLDAEGIKREECNEEA